MLSQLTRHRWVWFVQSGLTLLLGAILLYLRELFSDEVTGAFVLTISLLVSGFVVLVAALLDLAIAVEVAAAEHQPKSSLLWWAMGLIGLAVAAVVLLGDATSLRIVAMFAAAHAVLAAACNLTLLPSLRRHKMQGQFCVASSIGFLIFALGLFLSATTNDAAATKTVGIYAIFFGLQLWYVGANLPAKHRTPLALPQERSRSHAH